MAEEGVLALFSRPTSVFLSGESRVLLNWLAYALVEKHPYGFVWTDAQLDEEVQEPADLLRRNVLPADRSFTQRPSEFALGALSDGAALGGLVRSDEPPESIRRFADFLRLPAATQRRISRLPPQGGPVILVLSNAHRVVGFFPTEKVAPTLRAIVEAGATVFLVWVDAPSRGRLAFEHILRLEGSSWADWGNAVLVVERGLASGPLRTGTRVRLADLAPVAAVLAPALRR